jgi:fibronectin type 3 domain-containing protein
MRRSVLSITALAIAAAALLVSASAGLAADRYELVLESRSYVPETVRVARALDSHLVIQFYEIPTVAEREELARAGITLLDYIPNYAWTAHVRGGAVQSLDPGVVRAVFALRAEDKVARSAVDRDIVRAFVYDGVDGAEAVLGTHGQVIDQDKNSYTLLLESDVLELAAEDIVRYVMGPRPEKIENNDEIRDNINADEVQNAPYNLSGAGVTAGMWDNGSAATNHDDYNSRLTVGDGSSIGSHPAKVCGVMAGDGARSTNYGGYAGQWAGVAPGVDIASYSWPSDIGNMDSEHSHAISNYDIILSQNSWSWGLCSDYCEYYGEYDDWSQNFDKLVRGSQGKKITVVFSAGNDGDCSGCAWAIPGYPYGTIPGPGSTAKNAIVVGSNDADDDDLSYYSSMGPTLDGRLKPDVVAPGCKSYEGITTTYTSNNYYSNSCGTSFSAPAVSGCVAVLMEDYIDKFGGEAWPSTVKALLIQGAEDQGNVGPDFQFGYGRVNIQNTVDIIRTDNGAYDLIKEDTLSPAETWEYDISVTPGEDLKVTLVWDDFEGDYGAGGTMLVNDLDLELEAPGSGVYHPWVLDPGNPSWSATTGADHLNSVEQVEVASPASGTWTIRVTATIMPESNQDFSVVTNFAGGAPDLPPDAPTGLGAVPGTGEGEIDVSWDANGEPDLDHYRLERDDSPSFSSPSSFTTTNTYYDDSGLVPGDTYYYRVFAVDAGSNESDPSSTDSAVATDLPPAPPTGLVAVTGTNEGEIEISWNPSSDPDFDRYLLERSTAPDFEPGSEPFEGSAASYTDTGLVPGETYYYRVYAIDAGENVSAPSNVDSAVALDLDPSTPTGLVATPGVGEGEIDVSWNPNSEPDFDHYRLERHTDPGFGPGSDPFDWTLTFFPDSGLDPGETYYYRVIAVDEGGNESDPSVVDSAVATDLPPAAPTGLTAVPGAGEGEIFISWNPNSEPDLDRYRLERSLAPDFEPGSEPFEEPAVSFTDTGLIPGETYYYRVYAIDAGGNVSAPSNVDSAVATDLAPSVPTGLDAVPGTNEGDVEVSWDANPELDMDHYVLERDTDPGFGAPQSFITPNTHHEDSGLSTGLLYYYRVVAEDLGGNTSDPSAPASSYPRDLPPGAPTGLVALTGADEGDIDVSWGANPEPDIDHYRLERDTSAGFASPTSVDGILGTDYADSGLTPGQIYYYRVFAVDQGLNEGAPSNIDSAAAQDLAPAAPTGLAAVEGAGEGEVDVSWDANSELDLDHYRVERDTSALFGPETFTVDVSGTSLTDAGLDPDTYYYRVVAVDAGSNESVPSDTVSVTLEQTGIDEDLIASVSFIRPNPFTTQTAIHYTVPANGAAVSLRLYDIRGRLVKTLVDRRHAGGAYEVAWDGRDSRGRTVSSGIYFARVSIGDWGETRKIAFVR